MNKMTKVLFVLLLGVCMFACQKEPVAIPIIGISGSRANDAESLKEYIAAIERMGGIPLIIPITTDLNVISGTLKRIDGLLLTDGDEVDPRWYAQEPLHGAEYDVQKDTFDIFLAQRAMAVELPVLGINRGCLIMNLAKGGTLYHSLEEELGTEIDHYQSTPMTETIHTVTMNRNWNAGLPYAGAVIPVNSRHRQGIKGLASAFISMAESDDGLCEIFGTTDEQHMGVQYNPEMLFMNTESESYTIFSHFIQMARLVADNNQY